jgi:hypothetical protein
MTDIAYTKPHNQIYLSWIPDVVFHPRKLFQQIASHTSANWFTPLLILSVMVLINVAVTGRLKSQAAQMGEITYPPDFEYYTPEQQAQYMQAIQSTQGPVFIYVLPAIAYLAGVWFGWLILGGLLHLVTTLAGGRGSTAISMNIVAWASIPLAIREGVQILYMLFTKSLINNPGLSGFSLAGDARLAIFFNQFLRIIDIYLIWQVILIILGVKLSTGLSKTKSSLTVIITILIILLVRTGLSYVILMFSDLSITRPFFF